MLGPPKDASKSSTTSPKYNRRLQAPESTFNFKENISWDNLLQPSNSSSQNPSFSNSHDLSPGPPTSPFPVASPSDSGEFLSGQISQAKTTSKDNTRQEKNINQV